MVDLNKSYIEGLLKSELIVRTYRLIATVITNDKDINIVTVGNFVIIVLNTKGCLFILLKSVLLDISKIKELSLEYIIYLSSSNRILFIFLFAESL